MRSAIVLDGHIKSALATVRSLGRQHVNVWCGAERSSGMACHSRYVKESFVYPSPLSGQEAFIDSIEAVAEAAGDKPVVYAFSDATYLSLVAYKDRLAKVATLLFPTLQSIELAFDKGATYSEAKMLGIPTIKTYLFENKSELSRLDHELSYPAVVKPRHSVSWLSGTGVFGTAAFVTSRNHLEQVFSELKKSTGEAPLIQPFMSGEEYGVELMVDNGEVIAETTHHRLRSMSPRGGASVLKETVGDGALIDEMRGYARKLASTLAWSGPLMVEFKVDSDSRQPKLMELNGRFWGSLPLGIAAEIDFPYLFHNLASGRPLPATREHARAGIVTRHFLGDVRHLGRVLLARDSMRSLLYPSRKQAVRDFFRNPKGTKSDVWDWHDPLPALFEYVDVLKKKFAK